MAVGPRLRFEVFKRDNFTCRYCGRKSPEVILQADHVIPVAEGGGNEIENLVTSCFECNSGKGKILLTLLSPEGDVTEKAVLLAERERQLQEYNEVRRRMRERENADIQQIMEAWERLWGGRSVDYFPNEAQLRSLLNETTVYDLLDAVEIAAEKTSPSYARVRYFFGVAYNKARGPRETRDVAASPSKKGKKKDSVESSSGAEELLELLGFTIAVGGPTALRAFAETANSWWYGEGDNRKHLFHQFRRRDWDSFTAGLLDGSRRWIESPDPDRAARASLAPMNDLGYAIGFGGIRGEEAPAPAGDLLLRVRDALAEIYRTGRSVHLLATWSEEARGSFADGLIAGLRSFSDWRDSDKGYVWTSDDDLAHDLGGAIGDLGPTIAADVVLHLCDPVDFDRQQGSTTWVGPGWSQHRSEAFALGLFAGLETHRKRGLI
jgi:hypothetical protein